MKKFLAFMMFIAVSAHAITDEQLANVCLEKGKAKILRQANAWSCAVDLNDTAVGEVDNRIFNPSKYVWYQVKTPCAGYDRISVVIQYYNGQCF